MVLYPTSNLYKKLKFDYFGYLILLNSYFTMLLMRVMNNSSYLRTYAVKMRSPKMKKLLKCGTSASFAALGSKPSFKAQCQSSPADVRYISEPENVSSETKSTEATNITFSKTQHYSAQLNDFLKRISEPTTGFLSDLSIHYKSSLKEDGRGELVGLPVATTASELLRNIILRVCMGTFMIVSLVLGLVLCFFALWVIASFIENFPWIFASMFVTSCLAVIGWIYI
jgi:hypothetical protein